MEPEEILSNTSHRPWKIPNEDWKLYQEWKRVLFLHWEVEMEDLRKFVPPALEIDTFEGKPWVSLVAFDTENTRPRGLPSFSPISNFSEINIRTYIKSGERKGIYFLSLEANKLITAELTKLISELPYKHSKIESGDQLFRGSNKELQSKFEITYGEGPPKEGKNGLELWLSERYALFQDGREHIVVFEVLHGQWPLQQLHIRSLEVKYPAFQKLLQGMPQVWAYSPGVAVLVWGKEKWKDTQV